MSIKICTPLRNFIVVKVVLLGLLLFTALNGAESDCDYFQNVENGQTYYAYNSEYPNLSSDEKHCIWKMESDYAVKINCTIELSNDCNQNVIIFAEGNTFNFCGNNIFSYQGTNPIIKLDSIHGRFLCEIKTVNDNCKCGWKKVTRVVGGQTAEVNEYPMIGGIVDSTLRMIYCGCTIISERYVITAAHCVWNKTIDNIGIVVGEHNTSTGSDTNVTRLLRLEKFIIHPLYDNRNNSYNDVAICKTINNIEFSAEVGPACLPFQKNQTLFTNSNVTALGWGLLEFGGKKPNTLRKVDLNVVPLESCRNSYKFVTNGDIYDNNMCTYSPNQDTCQFDSGGPLLWQNPATNNLVLVGITSGGVGCGLLYFPSVAMRTGAFIDWIKSVTPDANYCQIE